MAADKISWYNIEFKRVTISILQHIAVLYCKLYSNSGHSKQINVRKTSLARYSAIRAGGNNCGRLLQQNKQAKLPRSRFQRNELLNRLLLYFTDNRG